MNKLLTLIIAFVAVSQIANADSVTPRFDLTGIWQSTAGGNVNIFQQGTEVIFINITDSYAHYYVGRYVSPTRVVGIQHRVTRATRCATEMVVSINVRDDEYFFDVGRALDSNCDLIKGQLYPDTVFRAL